MSNEKLKDLYPTRVTDANRDGVVAIEIEAEALEEVRPTADGWVTDSDGSLRYYGLEFKSRAPIKESKLKEHLATLRAAVDKVKFVENSPRTSVHVHVNVLGLTPSEIWTAITAGWLLEPAMMKMCHESRLGNLFCLRLQDAKGIFELIEEDINRSMNGQGYLPFNNFRGAHYRYSNFNLAAITKFGSIEVRALHGTFDTTLIENWARMCIGLVHRSKRFGSPHNLFDFVLKNGYSTFTKTVLGDELAEKLPYISQEEFEDQVERVLPMLLLCDWDEYNKLSWLTKKKSKKETLGSAAGRAVDLEAEVNWNNIRQAAHRLEIQDDFVPVEVEEDL